MNRKVCFQMPLLLKRDAAKSGETPLPQGDALRSSRFAVHALKRFVALAAVLVAFCTWADAPRHTSDPQKVKPQPHYGKIAQRLCAMLPAYHVLQRPLDVEISRRCWTNLVTQYDYNHAVFLASDLAQFEPMQTRIVAALRKGDVSFGFDVYRLFVKRLEERVGFATNLLAASDFDFAQKEDYLWKRKDAPWPKDRAEQDDLWRRRIKNELIAQVLGRELDAEEEARKKSAEKKSDAKDAADKKDAGKKSDAKDAKEEDDDAEPPLPPKENLVKRYRMLLQFFAEPDEEQILQRYLSALATALDPHSDYMSPMRKEDFDMDMTLSLCGVGATLSMDVDDGSLKIVEVLKGGPIDRDKRIKKGDKITGVGQGDGPVEDILYKPMRKTIRKIRGPKGTKVVLEILPKGASDAGRKRYALIRDEIKLETLAATGRVETVVLDGVTNRMGYVKLPGFYGTMDKKPGDPQYRSCSLDVAKYVASFNAANVDGMVLDLRGNGGGSLKEAVLLSQLFMGYGPVVQILGIRDTGFSRTPFVEPLYTFPDQPCFAFKKPLVVMTDRLSASASEIVAGCLQDVGRAVVVGDRQTHGKGTVQTVLPVGDETFGSTKITTARFYRINGSSTQVKGVAADVYLPSTLDGLDIGEDKLPNALPWTGIQALVYETCWNMPSLVDELKHLSGARRAHDEKWRRHVRAVEQFRLSAERKTVPLDRERRLKVMREEREMREIEDAQDAADDEDAEETALIEGEKNDRKDDLVLKEAFNVLADVVRLEHGKSAPVPRRKEANSWFYRALGR